MIPIRTFLSAAVLAALSACTQESSTTPQPDLSKKAKVVTFDVSGMT